MNYDFCHQMTLAAECAAVSRSLDRTRARLLQRAKDRKRDERRCWRSIDRAEASPYFLPGLAGVSDRAAVCAARAAP